MSYRNWTEEQKATYMLDALSRDDLSPEVLELIQGWMVGGDSAAGKEKALDAALDRLFDLKEDRRPDRRTYGSLARLHERIGIPAPEAQETQTPEAQARVRPVRPWLRVAAALVPLAVVAGALWLVRKPSSDPAPPVAITKAMVTPVADKDGRVTLSDGSVVRLVGDAKIMLSENFTENRHVKFSGEAFFSVVKNPEKPFIVETDRLTVTVLGTTFNLEAYAEAKETAVSLVCGQVEVTGKSGTIVLDPMEQLIYDKKTGESVVEEFTSDRIDIWSSGEQALNDVSLEQALRAIADFYGKKIVIEGVLPPNISVTTILKDRYSVEPVMEEIRLMNEVFTYTVGKYTIYVKGK